MGLLELDTVSYYSGFLIDSSLIRKGYLEWAVNRHLDHRNGSLRGGRVQCQ